ncbi:hypothetical protein [Xanthomonas citri]|uniref:hypothetical protein n=1 Tax=Xanthomonas citri TaxID=346 RepID=UPI000247CDCF|nr:hypothetical protein [Xanthomonas citri]MBE0317417.1 hypothetical protein [Xanthomonas citri pv. punicae]MDS0759997.1 hypothetical protein [Xanthomonas citri pv. punicae]MDS0763774.1 hypothetical protein [Xanthomonas citri pv. punicae]MDS0798545.1 hypothetical protein [Xanthomonas citri pv. punicae]MDS0831172.1 hypothetical protein [Xanthomonas citri pv. punicae]
MAKDLERADLMRVSQLIEPAGVHDAERQEGARRLGREAAVAQLQTLRPVPQRHALTARVTRVEQAKRHALRRMRLAHIAVPLARMASSSQGEALYRQFIPPLEVSP